MQRQDLKYGTHKTCHFVIRAELMDAIKTKQVKNHNERSSSRKECENSLDLDTRNNICDNKSASKKQNVCSLASFIGGLISTTSKGQSQALVCEVLR